MLRVTGDFHSDEEGGVESVPHTRPSNISSYHCSRVPSGCNVRPKSSGARSRALRPLPQSFPTSSGGRTAPTPPTARRKTGRQRLPRRQVCSCPKYIGPPGTREARNSGRSTTAIERLTRADAAGTNSEFPRPAATNCECTAATGRKGRSKKGTFCLLLGVASDSKPNPSLPCPFSQPQ